MKTAGKVPDFPVRFHIFLIIFILFDKYGKRYENELGYCGNRSVGLLYLPFSYWVEKYDNFSDFPDRTTKQLKHCSIGLACYLFSFNLKIF
jgi:hypothetical protein